MSLHFFHGDRRHRYRGSLWSRPFVLDVFWERREEGAQELSSLFLLVTSNCFILSNQLRDPPKYAFVTRFKVLRRLPDIIIVSEKFIPVFFLLLSNGVVVLLCRYFGRLFQVSDGLAPSTLAPGTIPPVGIYTPQLYQLGRPPSLGVGRWPGLRCQSVYRLQHR